MARKGLSRATNSAEINLVSYELGPLSDLI